jgi:5-(carboxyamino)imidazole ribonucleotide synthase
MKQRIGIVGGGQLGRMLGIAAKQLGFTVIVLDPNPNSPAGQVVDRQILGHYADPDAIRRLAAEVDFLTFEIEHTDADVLEEISRQIPVNPSPASLRIIQDKLAQKQFLQSHFVRVAESRAVETRNDVLKAIGLFGLPILLKARFDAYDGRGNALIRNEAGIDAAMAKLARRKLYCEQFISFQKELAVIAARGIHGEVATYGVVETIHRNNICHMVLAPADVEPGVASVAAGVAEVVMDHLDGAGVFGIEMFLTSDGRVVINEIAPRVHNSGHYTIEACVTSQFEQQIRAITGLPLGSTEQHSPAVMINLLGGRSGPAQVCGLDGALAVDNVGVHIYGKAETRLERKMGHLTATGRTLEQARERAKLAHERISI